MASVNFCPEPVEPWKLIMMTTYPFAANSSGFQRYDQSSPHAPCGPPWMRNFTGYFFEASKFGGLIDMRVKIRFFPLGVTATSSSNPPTSDRRGYSVGFVVFGRALVPTA